MIFGVIAVSKAFVPIFFGPGYEKVSILMNVSSPIILLIGLSNVTGTQYLLPTKRQREFTISVVIGAVVNFFMNLLLIRRFGAIGASIGTVVAEFSVTAVQAYFVRKDFNLLKIIKLSKNYLISSVIMFIICSLLGYIKIKGSAILIIQVFAGVMTYGACMIALKMNLFMGF